MSKIIIKRIYEPSEKSDGYRILVDRLWPRGLSKEKTHVDLWYKEIAPSDSLRKWFHRENGNWEEFVKQYKKELESSEDAVTQLKKIVSEHPVVTLLFGSKDTKHNQAVILQKLLG